MPPANDELQLPEIEDFNDDERLFAQVAVGITRSGGAMYVGRLLECRVGRLLNAQFPKFGISPWDLRIDGGIQVEVKTGVKSFSLVNKNSKDAAVWVFVHKPDSDDESLAYSVAARSQVCAIPGNTISAKKLIQLFGDCEESELAEAVAKAAAKPRETIRVIKADDQTSNRGSLMKSLPDDLRSLVETEMAGWESAGGNVRFTEKRIFFEFEISQVLRRIIRCDPRAEISLIRAVDLQRWGVDPALHEEYSATLKSATPAVRERCQDGKLWISFDKIVPADVSLLFSAARDLLQRIRRLG